MARKKVVHPLLVAALLAVGAVLVALLAQHPLGFLERQVTEVKYALRGPIEPDSNIALVYVDDRALRSLGWPVRRNFHALMIAALAELHVRAIGVDVIFEDRRVEYPEYDNLLASVARSAGMVVLPIYFDRLVDTAPETDTVGAGGPVVTLVGRVGRGAHLPYPALREAVPRLGHAHMEAGERIPLAIGWERELILPFALELVRSYLDGQRPAGERPRDSPGLARGDLLRQ